VNGVCIFPFGKNILNCLDLIIYIPTSAVKTPCPWGKTAAFVEGLHLHFLLLCKIFGPTKKFIMIKLQVIGHLGKDCTTNVVNGKNVINFSVAHSERYKDAQGNQKEKTTWVDCAYWTDRTAVAPYLKKGQLVYVEGAPEVRSYTKNDGTTGTSLTMRVLNVQLLGGGKTDAGAEMVGSGDLSQGTDSDDLPF
jgi:single-strand DNA-binding protein